MDEQPQNDGQFDALKNELAKEYIARRYFNLVGAVIVGLILLLIPIRISMNVAEKNPTMAALILLPCIIPILVIYGSYRQFRVQDRVARMNSSSEDE